MICVYWKFIIFKINREKKLNNFLIKEKERRERDEEKRKEREEVECFRDFMVIIWF